jgi:hypothetical protein
MASEKNKLEKFYWSKNPAIEELALDIIYTKFKKLVQKSVSSKIWESIAQLVKESDISSSVQSKISATSVKNFATKQKKLFLNYLENSLVKPKYYDKLQKIYGEESRIPLEQKQALNSNEDDALSLKSKFFKAKQKVQNDLNIVEDSEEEPKLSDDDIDTMRPTDHEPRSSPEREPRLKVIEPIFKTLPPKTNLSKPPCELCLKSLKKEDRETHYKKCALDLFENPSKKTKKIITTLDELGACAYCKDQWSTHSSSFKLQHLISCGKYHEHEFQEVINDLKSSQSTASKFRLSNLPYTPKLPRYQSITNQKRV